MKLISVRIITADVQRLVTFYEQVTGARAVWGNELFAEIPTPTGTLAIGSEQTVPVFGEGRRQPGRQPQHDRRVHRRRRRCGLRTASWPARRRRDRAQGHAVGQPSTAL